MSSFCWRRHRVTPVLGAGAVALLLAACGTSGGTAEGTNPAGPAADAAPLPKTLVFSPLSLAPPALKGLSEGVKGYGGAHGWEIITQDPNFDAAKQTQQLNEVIGSGRAGAAWVIAVAPASMAPILKSAQSKGIPILINGRPDEYGFSGPQPGISFGFIDYTAAGKALGEQLGKCIKEKLGGKAQVLATVSAEGTAGKKEFDTAAESALKAAAPQATIVQSIVGRDRAQVQTDVGSALQGQPDLAAVMAANDEGALGALGAFDAAGKKLECVTDFGGNDEVLAGVKAGKIFASVALQFEADMKQSFDTLVKMQADPKANGDVMTVPLKVVTANS
jgi:ABC-type sugar transport system substrate-binding protein